MGDWARLVEAVSTISNFVVTGDGILWWNFVIYGRLVKGNRSSLNNQKCFTTGDGRLGREFVIDGRLGKADISSLNNQQFFITGDGILGWDFMRDGRLSKDSVMETVSTIINVVITGDG